MKNQIVPTMLTHSLKEFQEKLELIGSHFDLLQIDCMDNKFVQNKTYCDADKIRKIRTFKGNYELHLMVSNPLAVIKKWQSYKKVKKIIFHYESMKDDQAVFDLIKYIQKKKIEVGLAINPETDLTKIKKFLPEIDTVLLMAVEPGWGGQTLNPDILNKAKLIRLQYPKLNIEIDGGVDLENMSRVLDSGVNIISAGSMFFKSENIKETIKQAKELIKK